MYYLVLTINGGTGDDAVNFDGGITFTPNANLDVNLQNDDATPGTDRVELGLNVILELSGTGTATIKVSRDVLLNSGAVIETEDGDLTVEANQQGTPTAGSFVGVDLNGGLIQATGTGIVSVKGKGGNISSGSQYGVQVRSGGDIIGGTSGTATVQGTGGASSDDFNHGVHVTGAGSTITSTGGNVSVTGQGGGQSGTGSDENIGVRVGTGSLISAGRWRYCHRAGHGRPHIWLQKSRHCGCCRKHQLLRWGGERDRYRQRCFYR
ncbi:MAG: hypothetical protein IPM98_12105 [Lewinellaceae bacterium]|nr:hypothetical protein [Lewinellaceae bacterium]